MARMKPPRNKAYVLAPENKGPLNQIETQLRRMLKAEHDQWVGNISRAWLHKLADDVRAELNGQSKSKEDNNGA